MSTACSTQRLAAMLAGLVLVTWLIPVAGCNTAAPLAGPATDGLVIDDPDAARPSDGDAPPVDDAEDYDAKLARLQAGGDACRDIRWAVAGTCGEMLFIVETNGFVGRRSYFDPQTRALVAWEAFSDIATDAAAGADPVECGPRASTQILCVGD